MFTPVKGRSVLVTGASRGIGKGIARVFAQAGAKVAVIARSLNQAEATAKEISLNKETTCGLSANVNDLSEMQIAAETVAKRYGTLDVLCANAGIYPEANIEKMTPDEWDEVLGTNLKGTFISIKACLPYLKRSDGGRVIMTSSITGPITGFPGWAHYGASKAGQLGFMRTACLELAKYGITINAIMPGNILTEGLQDLGQDYLQTMTASIPLKRLGSVEDIGHAALFLSTKEAGYITGQTIVVDGGQTQPESLEALGG